MHIHTGRRRLLAALIVSVVLIAAGLAARSAWAASPGPGGPASGAPTDCYDMTGATYNIYSDPGCTAFTGHQLIVTDNSGNTNRVQLSPGTYYVRETAPQPGSPFKGYIVSGEVHQVAVSSGGVAVIQDASEPMMNDPVAILVQKAVDDTGESGKREGDIPSLAGARFRVDYYSGLYPTIAETQASGHRKASATWQTDDAGFIHFALDAPVSGTWGYKDSNGANTIPLGTVVITETEPITGTVVNGSGELLHITDPGTHANPAKIDVIVGWDGRNSSADAAVAYANRAVSGGVSVTKADADEDRSAAQGDATLDGVEYTVYNESDAPVSVTGTPTNGALKPNRKIGSKTVGGEYAIGEAILRLKSSKRPDGTHGIDVPAETLPYGTYRVTETAGTASYRSTGWTKRFSIGHAADGVDASTSGDRQIVRFTVSGSWNADPVRRGGLLIVKADKDWNRSEAQGDGTLAGIVYKLYNQSSAVVRVAGADWQPGAEIKGVRLVSAWNASTGRYECGFPADALPYGTYKVVEAASGDSYLKADWTRWFSIGYENTDANGGRGVDAWAPAEGIAEFSTSDGGGDAAHGGHAADFDRDAVARGGATIVKADLDRDRSRAQGDATLAGARYSITNRSRAAVFVEGRTYPVGAVVKTIETAWDDDTSSYRASTPTDCLPYGTYDIDEVAAPVGYVLSGFHKTFRIRHDKQMVWYTDTATPDTDAGGSWSRDAVQRGGVVVGKVDRETHQYVPEGDATLGDAVFEIANKSKYPVWVEGRLYQVGDVVKTISTSYRPIPGVDPERSAHIASTDVDTLPYGTYEVREVDTGEGYIFDHTSRMWKKTFTVGHDGGDASSGGYAPGSDEHRWTYLTNEDTLACANQVSREDFHFTKKDRKTEDRMPGIAWLITSRTTGERHVIVTNSNGEYHSSCVESEDFHGADHTRRTDANDPDSPLSNGSVGVNADGDYVVVDPSKLDASAGTWFTGIGPRTDPPASVRWHADGASYDVVDRYGRVTTAEVDDSLRAFPYDEYELRELATPGANDGHNLVCVGLTLKSYTKDPDGPGLDFDYGTIFDDAVGGSTSLIYDGDGASARGDHVAPAARVRLTDTLSHWGLDERMEYTARGELRVLDADGADTGRVVARGETRFRPTNPYVDETAIAYDLDATDLGGSRVVSIVRVIDSNGQTVLNLDDAGAVSEQVSFPSVETDASGDVDREANADGDASITDAVHYAGFVPGRSYTVTGELHRRAVGPDGSIVDGGAVTDADGEPVTASRHLVFRGADGDVDISFDLRDAAGDLAGSDLTVELRVSAGYAVYASHGDIADDRETVSFPKLSTRASGSETGTHQGSVAKSTGVVDEVRASDLVVGNEYRIDGELHLIDVADDGSISDGGVVRDADGEPVTGSATFRADAREVVSRIRFDLDASDLAGRSVAVFETLSRGDVELAAHRDVADGDQTVRFPDVSTSIGDAATGSRTSQVPADGSNLAVRDAVSLSNLVPGATYRVRGSLHRVGVGESGEPTDDGVLELGDDGDTASIEVTAADDGRASGSLDFSFKAPSDLPGTAIVAVDEVLDAAGVRLVDAADPADADETMHIAKVETRATDVATGGHTVSLPGRDGTVTVRDHVSLSGLEPGREYTVSGSLQRLVAAEKGDEGAIDLPDGGRVRVDGPLSDASGRAVSQTATVKPSGSSAEVDIDFAFAPPEGFAPCRLAAFEDVSIDGVVVASHRDAADPDQTVSAPSISTSAVSPSGGKTIGPDGSGAYRVIDRVSYRGLVPGESYVLTGRLMTADGDPIGGGDPVDFSPKSPDGAIEVPLAVDPRSVADGVDVVAVERLDEGSVAVAEHDDLTDRDQTTRMAVPRTPIDIVTGLAGPDLAIAVAATCAITIGLGTAAARSRRARP